MREYRHQRKPPADRIELKLNLGEAQLIFDLLGRAILPADQRQTAMQIYQRLVTKHDFINGDEFENGAR